MSISLARRNLLHEKGKLALSVSGVAAALALIVILMGFRDGLYVTLTAYMDNLGADLVVAQSGVQGLFSSNSAIPVAIHDELVSASGAVEAGHVLIADVIFTHGDAKTPVLLVGYNSETGMGGPWNLDALLNGARAEEITAAQAQVDAAQAQLDTLDVQLAKFTLTAPRDGILLTRSVEPGETALPGAILLKIGRLDLLELTVYLPEDRFGMVTTGQTAEVRVDTYPDRVFTGTVLRVADEAEFGN